MKASDLSWIDKWSRTMCRPIVENYVPGKAASWGPVHDPEKSLLLASFVDPLDLGEGFVILDYGCGEARLVNFLSERFSSFLYYGLEKDNSWGRGSLELANKNFGHDSRVRMGYVGQPLEAEAVGLATHATLISVFTHLPFSHFESIMATMSPILDRDGSISFSVFLADAEQQSGRECYEPDDFLQSFYMLNRLRSWAHQHQVSLRHVDSVLTGSAYYHEIFVAKRHG